MDNVKNFKDLFESISDYRKMFYEYFYVKMIKIFYTRLVLVNMILIDYF